MKKIILGLSVIAAVAAVVVYGTGAFFSDTETSTGNTFTAGAIDLKVDNTCYYNEIADGTPSCPMIRDEKGDIITTWKATDLGPMHKFFWFKDVKPGDFGEDTISLHVIDNDAWGRLVINKVGDYDNDCTEPEDNDSTDETCGSDINGEGELRSNTNFMVWLDQGMIPGFQNNDPENPGIYDEFEGDNIQQEEYEPTLITPGTIDFPDGEVWYLAQGLQGAYYQYCYDEDVSSDGHNDYDLCHGLAEDGRMVGSVTYYFGVGWQVPYEVGNEVQTDSFGADMTVEVQQYRNNPNPWE
ncbi:MAG: TasA family protein [Patescibacteria group bacterium]